MNTPAPYLFLRLICIFAVNINLLVTHSWGQANNQATSGAVILLSSKGLVQVLDPSGNQVAGPLNPGTVLAEGFSVKTGFAGEVSVLFSNGTVATIEPRTQITIESFLQKPFDAANRNVSDLLGEPSSSQLKINLASGDLVVKTKKLNRASSFTIITPVGTAGIRGTEFQMGLDAGGGAKLDVSSSVVEFTPPGGATVAIGKGEGLNISPTGSLSQRPINPAISANINSKNSAATNVSARVPLATVNQAKTKASALITSFNNGSSKGSRNSSETKAKDNQDSENKKAGQSQEEKTDSRSSAIQKSALNLRSISGTEVSKGRFEYERKIEELLAKNNGNTGSDLTDGVNPGNPPTEGPGTSPPDSNPGNPPSGEEPDVGLPADKVEEIKGQVESISYSFNHNTNELIFKYLDSDGNELESASLAINNSTNAAIDQMFNPWENNADKDLDILGVQVFMEELVVNPNKYNNNINDALHDAISLARIFLTEINLQNVLPAGNVWNAQRLIGQFTSNPYAFEFGQLLIRYNAFGESNDPTITNIGNQILNTIGGRNNLSDSNYLNDLLSKSIQPGATFNGKTLNGELLGTRTAKISAEEEKLLEVNVQNINGIIGSGVTIQPPSGSNQAVIDVSPYLTKANSSGDKKVFAIAAVKDLHIDGDVRFVNSNHSEDHALSIGAADDITIKEGSRIYNEGSNLGIGAYDKLELVNVDIDTGGNLAIGSLDELHIKSTNPYEESKLSSTFSVGRYSDSDNLYLYADKLIDIDGLRFSGNMREIYMEAITIDLKNINFPSQSEVMLRSELGQPTFGPSNRVIGAVNFIENVSHGSRAIDSMQDFNPTSSGYNSSIMSGNSPAIKIRKFPN
jgi:hypothetical protein